MFRLPLSGLLVFGVVAQAWSQAPQPVKVDFGARGPASGGVYRVGDDCLASTETLAKWGWSCVARGKETSISAEGRIFRVTTQFVAGQPAVSLSESANYLGAVAYWNKTRDTYRFKASIRNLDITNEGFQIDATTKVQPSFKLETNPWRLIVDLKGGEMDRRLAENLPEGWKVGQFDDDTVRLVIENPLLAGMVPPRPVETRSVRVKLPKALMAKTELPDGEPLTILESVATPGASSLPVKMEAPTVTGGEEGGVVLRVPTSRRLDLTPSVRYISPTTIALTIQGATFGEAGEKIVDDKFLRGYVTANSEANSTLTINLKAAGAFILNTQNDGLVVRLFRPKKGKLSGKIIVVDPGHGGKDPGADWGNALFEKDLALKISLATAKALQAAGASVIMTRDADTYPTLSQRSQLANQSDAAALICIHINSNTVAETRSGGITFYHAQNPVGRMLASCVQNEIAKIGTIPDLGIWSDTRIYRNGFQVLREVNVPAAYLELGFITHSHDRKAMQEDGYPEQVGAAVVRGLKAYFGEE
ncbi:MAG: N-acetylmuramoyl-L-alanine amidase [Armatimonadetes bacterium]|nr:N-acetylmuramoyl-L-alanine amidase [Armatimonadota bacterium]